MSCLFFYSESNGHGYIFLQSNTTFLQVNTRTPQKEKRNLFSLNQS